MDRLEELEDLRQQLYALAGAQEGAFAAMANLNLNRDAEENRGVDCAAGGGGGDGGEVVGEGDAGGDNDRGRNDEHDDSGDDGQHEGDAHVLVEGDAGDFEGSGLAVGVDQWRQREFSVPQAVPLHESDHVPPVRALCIKFELGG